VDGKSIVVVEDDPAISDVVDRYLRRDGFATTICKTASSARAALAQARPALMILDVGLPDGSGLDVLREVAARKNPVPAIVLTARSDESDRIVALELGADDYVTKPFFPRELMARIRAVLRRLERSQVGPAHDVLKVGGLELDLSSHDVVVDGKTIDLTPTEFRVLSLLAASPGEVFTRAAILDRLHDTGRIFERTLDRHINNLRSKLEPDSRKPVYLVTVYGVGYKLCAPRV
jgi:DNA-binding response OmpR family regulator